MSHIHYKFSSKLDYDTVVFDRLYVSLKDLKSQIMGREKLRVGDCDLQITNAQSKEEYKDDDCSIPKGSSVIVRRIPVIGGKSSSSKTRHIERSDVQTHQAFGAYKAMDDQSSSRAVPFFAQIANLADVDGSEEDKIKAMMTQSSYGTLNYTKKFGTVLPANYTCYRCGNTGHHIRNCPVNVQDKNFQAPTRIKKSTGIPRSFMVEVDDPNTKGAMLTSCGRYAVPTIDIAAYAIGKKERPPFLPQEQPETEEEEDPVSEELLCLLCHDLLSDAVVIPCCGNSYCDDCIRTALLDSEDHVCPTCSQPDVSPDNLIANKFLRQAVDYFKKEQGVSKSQKKGCGPSQSQNPTLTPSPVPTPPPVGEPSLPRKPPPSTSSQLDPLLHHSQAAHTPPPVAQVCVAPPTATGPASSAPTASLQPVQSHLEEPDKEAEEKTSDDSAAAATPSVPVSPKDPTDAPSQLIPVAKLPPLMEPPQTVGLNVEPPPSGPAPKPSAPPTSWESSSSSSLCPPGGWNESTAQQPPPSVSSYPSTPPPPLFPSPHFHTFLAAQQPLPGYPPGYPPTPPLWALPNLQGSPIPSLCPLASIPALIPSEWFQHQRKKERSPHGGSSHRRSSSRSEKFKSSRSSSRSRSRSHGRSRPHSPYSRRGDLHSRSTSSRSYSYGYKRSPTPSSSSSPRVGYRSRPKAAAAADRGKSVSRSRHHSKKSSSSSYGTRRQGGEHHQREARPSGGSLPGQLHAQRANQSGGQELDRERYLQWNRDYKEWCDKYFSSYVGHFHQLPVPLLNIPPPPQWGGGGEGGGDAPDSRGRAARPERRSPRSSSDSRSLPSRSSRDSRSTPSRSSSDSRSSPSRSSDGSRSSRSSGSTPSKDGAPRAERAGRRSVPLAKGGKVAEPREGREDEKKATGEGLENLATVKHEQEEKNGGEEESSSPDAADSTDACRKDERRRSTGPDAFKDGPPARDEAAAGDAVESAQPLLKPDKRSDKDDERKSRAHRTSDKETGRRRGRRSDSRPEEERRHKEKKSRERDAPDADSRSERSRKRKGEDVKRSSLKVENSKSLKTNTAEDPKPRRSESPNPFDRKKPKMEKKKERKTWPLTERDIWEGGIPVKPQKKININININLDGNRKEEGTEKEQLFYIEKTKMAANGETENDDEDVDGASEEKITPDEGDARQKWEKATFRDDEGEMLEKKDLGEKKEDFDFWHSAPRGEEETTKESEKQGDERDGMEASKGEELSDERGVEAGPAMAESTCEENRDDLPGESKEEEEEEEEDTLGSQRSRNQNHRDGPNSSVDHGSSGGPRQQSPMVKALEEEHAEVVKVPRTKREEEERREGVAKAQADALASSLPSETRTNRDWQKEEKRERSVERERGREREKSPHRRVAPSSGKDRNDSAAYSDRERRRDRVRERPRERESKRSREGEKGRDGEQQRNPPSSSHSKSHDTERRDAKSSPPLSRKCSGGRRRESRALELPERSTHTSKCQHEDHRQDPPGCSRPPGARLSPPPPSQSHERDPDFTPNKTVEKEEWKLRPGREEGTNGETVAVRAGGGPWEEEEGE
ncbi:E3 ubiquitin-protein ligase RBBP6-like isoform X2 [Pseudoliparis swirei]|uniref:E3 ubiquitin-protein ligase RBBP6-like isoform X2 n=1 Tax=Pseudoliparis swirei TaxID=2059687 RepID=UPI0024BE340D|nr:E3 ubiquitin-protein ligase RBBP6-like isoform X2 [Pseudoliparis swirei]